MKKAYLYRLYPTAEQATLLQQQLDVAREVYNACLSERREAYRLAGQTLNYYAQANQLKDIRRDCPDIGVVNCSMLQAICRRAQRSYESFFRRLRAWKERKAQGLPVGKKPGPPRFKGYLRFNSVTFPSYGDGCKLSGNRLYIAVDSRGTSQTCVCGEPVPKDLTERWHHCPRCGLSLPRDQVSAMLIKAVGLEMLAEQSRLGSSRQALTRPGAASVA